MYEETDYQEIISKQRKQPGVSPKLQLWLALKASSRGAKSEFTVTSITLETW